MALKGLLNSVYTIVFGVYAGEDGCRKGTHCFPAPTKNGNGGFQLPLHYPRYKKGDNKKMEEWKLDCLLREYGLSFNGSLHVKRDFAIGAFVRPDQCQITELSVRFFNFVPM